MVSGCLPSLALPGYQGNGCNAGALSAVEKLDPCTATSPNRGVGKGRKKKKGSERISLKAILSTKWIHVLAAAPKPLLSMF